MRRIAVEKASARLARAKVLLEEFRKGAENHADFVWRWTEFLLATNSVFTTLEQGAKGSRDSEKWMSLRKGQRRNDALLRYLHQARNSDEHGLDPVSTTSPVRFVAAANGDQSTVSVTSASDKSITLTLDSSRGKVPTKFVITQGEVRLVPVVDRRYNTTFDVPNEHMGDDIPDPHPVAVAELAITYYNKMIKEAGNLITE